MRTPFLALSLLAASLLTLPALAAERPNIVVILVDDMGFSDLGCYGSEIETPHLDSLADNGLRFSQFYNTGRCCPTRASLLTGLYAHQAGIGHMTRDQGKPGYRGALNDRCLTIAEALKPAGYFTITTGKWHVGSDDGQRPAQRGFDRSFVVPEGGGFYFKVKKGRTIRRNDEVTYTVDKNTPDDWYSTRAWTDEGLAFVDEALAADKPFFWYLAHNAPHFPLQAPPETIDKYRGKYTHGFANLRKERYARQLEIGLFKKAWPLTERDSSVKGWLTASDKDQKRLDEIMAIYAACVEEMDKSVGQVIAALKERKVLDNTLILFMSDNGASAEGGDYGKYVGETPGDGESNIFAGKAWANASNTPFLRYKKDTFEGGIATPLIAHWPARLQDPGRTTHAPGHVIDIMSTCLAAAEATYPDDEKLTPLEGQSLLPLFDPATTTATPAPRTLYWEHEGNRAIRHGDWKLVAYHNKDWALYNLANDRTEFTDLSDRFPDTMEDLSSRWIAWSKRVNVLPWPIKK